MGFCLLNNIAVAAAKLTSEGERVLIVDWDVHHGNGTQAMFWNDPNVLYVSSHQWPLYPGSGGAREVGGLDAVGTTVNIPLPARTTGDVLRRGFEELAAPVIDDFAPTWVLVSAGFDAHRDDPLADLALSSGDFANLATMVAHYAKANRLALFLEGGYNLEALRRSVAATFSPLLDIEYQREAITNSTIGISEIARSASERYVAIESAREQRAAEGESS
jgi:acetoin utilization deacetylase AcuC-like enzyme